jgi:hypothetical protein
MSPSRGRNLSRRRPASATDWLLAGLTAASLHLAGCGGHESSAPVDGNGDETPEDPKPSAPTELESVEFSMSAHIGAGVETQRCLSVQMPTDRGVIAVPKAESHYTPGSHHFLVYRTGEDELPPGGDEIHECGAAELVDFRGTYYEAQVPDEERSLPDGVAHLFQPGEVLLLTSHYVNTKEVDVDADMKFTLHTVDPDAIEHEAGSIFFYNYDIVLPPNSERTVSRTCPIPEEMNLALLWSHMHERGVGFRASTDDALVVNRLGGDLYDSDTWNEPPARAFDSALPVMLHAGATITYECDFKNQTANTIVQGPSAVTNEMCILHGMYWPRVDPSIEECLGGTSTTR